MLQCDKEGAEVERVKTEMSSKVRQSHSKSPAMPGTPEAIPQGSLNSPSPGQALVLTTAAAPEQAELLPEEWGGDVPMVSVSAKTGMGIDELLETITLMSEVRNTLPPFRACSLRLFPTALDHRSQNPEHQLSHTSYSCLAYTRSPTSLPSRIGSQPVPSSRPTWTVAAARSPPCSCRTEPSRSAIPLSQGLRSERCGGFTRDLHPLHPVPMPSDAPQPNKFLFFRFPADQGRCPNT